MHGVEKRGGDFFSFSYNFNAMKMNSNRFRKDKRSSPIPHHQNCQNSLFKYDDGRWLGGLGGPQLWQLNRIAMFKAGCHHTRLFSPACLARMSPLELFTLRAPWLDAPSLLLVSSSGLEGWHGVCWTSRLSCHQYKKTWANFLEKCQLYSSLRLDVISVPLYAK